MRLIDADKLKYKVGVNQDDRQIFYIEGKDIDAQPTVDAAPVAHGRWVYSEEWGDLFTNKCSLCNQTMTTTIGKFMKYCPNCGAKMGH